MKLPDEPVCPSVCRSVGWLVSRLVGLSKFSSRAGSFTDMLLSKQLLNWIHMYNTYIQSILNIYIFNIYILNIFCIYLCSFAPSLWYLEKERNQLTKPSLRSENIPIKYMVSHHLIRLKRKQVHTALYISIVYQVNGSFIQQLEKEEEEVEGEE